MENQPTSTKQIALSYGLILGFLSIVISVIYYAMGKQFDQSYLKMFLGFAVLIISIVLGLRQFKIVNKGYLSLGQSFKIGLGIALIASLVVIAYTYIFAKFVEPDFVSKAMEHQQNKMLESNANISDEQLEMIMTQGKKWFFVFTFGAIFIANIFFSFIISLIAGLIMKKTPEQEY